MSRLSQRTPYVPSPRRVEANRRNAQKSTGPKTAEGKAISRLNGVKHGLTGAGIALPTEVKEQVEGCSRRFAMSTARKTRRRMRSSFWPRCR